MQSRPAWLLRPSYLEEKVLLFPSLKPSWKLTQARVRVQQANLQLILCLVNLVNSGIRWRYQPFSWEVLEGSASACGTSCSPCCEILFHKYCSGEGQMRGTSHEWEGCKVLKKNDRTTGSHMTPPWVEPSWSSSCWAPSPRTCRCWSPW